MVTIYDAAGLVGVALAIYAYARVQWQRDYAKKLSYSVCNLCNSSLLAFSLTENWNLAAFIGNMIWILLSLYGIYRCLKYDRRKKKTPAFWRRIFRVAGKVAKA